MLKSLKDYQILKTFRPEITKILKPSSLDEQIMLIEESEHN
jgi:hypothetical protein